MNTTMKILIVLSIVYSGILFLFKMQIGAPGYLMFLGSYLVVAGLTIYDEFITTANWPVKAVVFEKRQGMSEKFKITRARRNKGKDGKFTYEIKGYGKMNPIDYDKLIPLTTSGFKSEDVLLLSSNAPGQLHPITKEDKKDLFGESFGNLKVIPQELINFIVQTHRDKYAAHPDKKSGWSVIFENPAIMFSVACVVLVIAGMLFWQNIMLPTIQEGRSILYTMQKTTEANDVMLTRMEHFIDKYGYPDESVTPPPPPPL